MIASVYFFLTYWIVLAVFGLGLVALNLIAPILRLLFRSRSVPLCQALVTGFCRFYFKLTSRLGALRVRFIDWPDDLDKRAGIFVSNHPSKLDAVALLSKVPRSFCIFKDSLRSSLLFGNTTKAMGYVSNREKNDGIRKSISQVKSGMNLIVFPEGTRSTPERDPKLLGSYSVVSKYSNTPIHICSIHTNSNLLRKGHRLWQTPIIPVIVEIHYHGWKDPSDYSTAGDLHRSVSAIFHTDIFPHA